MKLNRKMRRAGIPSNRTYTTDRSTEVRRVICVEVGEADQHGEDESARVLETYTIRYTVPALGGDVFETDLGTWKREGWR